MAARWPSPAPQSPCRRGLKISGEFTPRERQVLTGLAQGRTVKEIALALYGRPGVGIKSVEAYCTGIKNKQGLENMHQLIAYAVRNFNNA